MNGTPMRTFIRFLFAVVAFSAIASAQQLSVTPSSLTFNTTVGGGDPADQSFQIQTSTPGQVFSARVRAGLTNPGYITLFPTNGQTPANVTVSISSSGFANSGKATAYVDVTINATGQTSTVTVEVFVGPPGSQPSATVTPTALSFNAATADSTVSPQTLSIRNTGGGVLSYTLRTVYPSGPTNWITVAPTNGTSSNNIREHTVQVSPTGLPDGAYTAQILVEGNGSNSPRTIPVTLTVGGEPPPSGIEWTPTTLSFIGPQGGDSPPFQTLTILNKGGGSVTYTLVGSEPWLRAQPEVGKVSTGSSFHNIFVETLGLQAGTYTANLALDSPSLASPLMIPVTLQVTPPGIIFTQPSSLDFFGRQGMPLREKRVVSVINTPLGPGRWSASVTSPNSSWLKVSPTIGTIPGQLVVEVDTAGLGADTLEANIQIATRRSEDPTPLSEARERRRTVGGDGELTGHADADQGRAAAGGDPFGVDVERLAVGRPGHAVAAGRQRRRPAIELGRVR